MSSISMPPCADAMTRMRSILRSSTKPRYSSRVKGSATSTYSRFTTLPCGPVWLVTRVAPSIALAAAATSA